MYNPFLQNRNFNSFRVPSMEEFRIRLTNTDDGFFERMKNEARRRGISEQNIEAGMNFIQQLRR